VTHTFALLIKIARARRGRLCTRGRYLRRAAQAGVASPVAAFYPSLRLNSPSATASSATLTKPGSTARRGSAVVTTLPDDGYGRTIKGALDRLAERLTSA